MTFLNIDVISWPTFSMSFYHRRFRHRFFTDVFDVVSLPTFSTSMHRRQLFGIVSILFLFRHRNLSHQQLENDNFVRIYFCSNLFLFENTKTLSIYDEDQDRPLCWLTAAKRLLIILAEFCIVPKFKELRAFIYFLVVNLYCTAIFHFPVGILVNFHKPVKQCFHWRSLVW
jgi:hypothetical protein